MATQEFAKSWNIAQPRRAQVKGPAAPLIIRFWEALVLKGAGKDPLEKYEISNVHAIARACCPFTETIVHCVNDKPALQAPFHPDSLPLKGSGSETIAKKAAESTQGGFTADIQLPPARHFLVQSPTPGDKKRRAAEDMKIVLLWTLPPKAIAVQAKPQGGWWGRLTLSFDYKRVGNGASGSARATFSSPKVSKKNIGKKRVPFQASAAAAFAKKRAVLQRKINMLDKKASPVLDMKQHVGKRSVTRGKSKAKFARKAPLLVGKRRSLGGDQV
jgi:hypothetical protein